MRALVPSVVAALTLSLPALGAEEEAPPAPEPRLGEWSAWLDSPGGNLPFTLTLSRDEDEALTATITNAEERIDIPTVALEGDRLLLGFDHYDSRIEATLSDAGDRLHGAWTKTGRNAEVSTLPFHAIAGRGLPEPSQRSQTMRYSVYFEKSGPAVAVLTYYDNDVITGTFMTPTGDYRYLHGQFDPNGAMRLACFDGAHAFLFRAVHATSQAYDLKGRFWSRDTWQEVWRAKRDPDAKLPDAFTLTEVVDKAPDLSRLVYTNLDGEEVSLADLRNPDRPMIIEVFGSWCPNCHDAASHLAAIQREYDKTGLVIVGLAFELTDDLDRSIRQVRTFRNRHSIDFPLLIAGKADKENAAKRIPIIDKVRSYPTAIFIDAEGEVRAVYTGYSGPATGEAHTRLKEDFDRIIRQMLDEVIK